MLALLKVIAVVLTLLNWALCIVNPDNESARMVIYLQKPSSLGPSTWLAGVNCLDKITRLFFQKRESLTRTPNLVMTIAKNMSTPAAQIQERFLKMMMESVSEIPRKRRSYQMRIVSDSQPYKRLSTNHRELVLADYYIMVVDSLERLSNLLQNYVSQMLSWNPGARFLILYNNVNDRNKPMETARAIFQFMMDTFYIHRVGLVYATEDKEYDFLLMDYFDSSSCRTLQVKNFTKCRNDQLEMKNSRGLAAKLDSFFNSLSLTNCTFNMCASIAAPFVEDDCVFGLEMRIIGFIKTRLNFNVSQNGPCLSFFLVLY